MKSRKLLVALVAACALALSLGLFGCGGGGDDGGAAANDAPGTPTTIDYASFNMPDGWDNAPESDSYVTIAAKDDDEKIIKIFRETLFSDETIESVAAKRAGYYDAEPGEPIVVGETEWIPVDFTFNDLPSRFFYAPVDDGHYMYVTAYTLTDADEPVQTVLSTLSVAVEEE